MRNERGNPIRYHSFHYGRLKNAFPLSEDDVLPMANTKMSYLSSLQIFSTVSELLHSKVPTQMTWTDKNSFQQQEKTPNPHH